VEQEADKNVAGSEEGGLVVPKGFKITREDLQRHGASKDCPGCKSLAKGTRQQAHSKECRRRLGNLMRDGEKVKRSRNREATYFEDTYKRMRKEEVGTAEKDNEAAGKRRKRSEEGRTESQAEDGGAEQKE